MSLAILLSLVPFNSAAVAQDGEGGLEFDSAARELAERHSPIFVLKAQNGDCDSDGEAFAPMAVDAVLNNPDVLLRQAGVGDPVVKRAPSAADLFGRGDGFFLDFNGLALQPGCTYERDYRRYTGGESVVYAHVVQQADEPDFVAVQYWIYWYFNDWNNKHESDWEFVQVLFEAPSIDAALASDPLAVGYAQHEGGERSLWNDEKLERSGTHPVVYSSAGSHASYYDGAIYLGRRGTEGFGCDTTTGPSVRVEPDVVVLPDEADSSGSPFAWMAFEGRWGERHGGAFNGPTGPAGKERWNEPVDWHQSLRSRSVAIPGGAQGNTAALSRFCSVVDWGSNQLRGALVSPTRLLVGLALAGSAGLLVARRTVWIRTSPVPLKRRRHIGQMLRLAASSYWSSRGAVAGFAAASVPFAALLALVGYLGSFTAAQAAAALFSALLYAATVSAVAAYWHSLSGLSKRPFQEAVALAWRRAPAVARTALRSYVIIVLLAITVIGLPFAIRQAVRWQFSLTVATIEGLSGRAALKRSATLVQGRWWRSALALVLLTSIAGLLNSALQVGLLVALTGLPLWLYTAIAFLLTGFAVPMAATAPTLLYGDAVAVYEAAQEHEAASPGVYEDA